MQEMLQAGQPVKAVPVHPPEADHLPDIQWDRHLVQLWLRDGALINVGGNRAGANGIHPDFITCKLQSAIFMKATCPAFVVL